MFSDCFILVDEDDENNSLHMQNKKKTLTLAAPKL